MGYPAGTSLAVITSGKAANFLGKDLALEATVTPLLGGTTHLWHAETGALLIPQSETFKAEPDAGISASVPHVDQLGWRDSAGNAYTGWAYEVEIKVGNKGSKNGFHSWKKIVKPVVGQAIVDVDAVPDMAAGEPVVGNTPAVTSVQGATGAVTLTVTETEPGVYTITGA